jgi:hypothetical protein
VGLKTHSAACAGGTGHSTRCRFAGYPRLSGAAIGIDTISSARSSVPPCQRGIVTAGPASSILVMARNDAVIRVRHISGASSSRKYVLSALPRSLVGRLFSV